MKRITAVALLALAGCAPEPWGTILLVNSPVLGTAEHDPRPVHQLHAISLDYPSREACEQQWPGRCAQRQSLRACRAQHTPSNWPGLCRERQP